MDSLVALSMALPTSNGMHLRPRMHGGDRFAGASDGAAAALERAELVPAALHLLVYLPKPPPEAAADGVDFAPTPAAYARACELMLVHHLAPVLLGVVFDAIRTLVRMTRAALELRPGVDIYSLAFHAGVAMEVLAELCATPLFYQRYSCVSVCFCVLLCAEPQKSQFQASLQV